MSSIKASLLKIAVCSFALLAISTVYAKNASANRYALAFISFSPVCTGNPGNECGPD